MQTKTVGILGGMGPEATVDLMQRIIRLTPAQDDSDHIRCLVDNNPKIPSRIKALIEGNGEDPGPCLVTMAQGLERSGADFLAIACNTAHYYHQTISNAVNIPVINIVDQVLSHIDNNYSQYKSIAILASPAVQLTRLYEGKFNTAGIEIIYPETEHQQLLFTIIKAVKTGNVDPEIKQQYVQICEQLKDSKLAIIACTELSLLGTVSTIHTIDATEVLAIEIIRQATVRR